MKIFLFRAYLLVILVLFSFSLKAAETVIEAEAGVRIGSATIVNSSLCSGGRKVGNLGGSANNGGVKFSFSVSEAGKHWLQLYYLAGESRNFKITVNQGASITVNCPSTGSWDIPGIVSVDIDLTSGLNMILINNGDANAPDLDFITIGSTDNGGSVQPDIRSFSLNKWKIDIDQLTGKSDFFYNGNPLISKAQLAFKESSNLYFSENLKERSVTESPLEDLFGTGKQIQISAKTADGKIQIRQNFYLYTGKDYILTDFTIESAEVLSSNYMAPVYSTSSTAILPSGDNKSLWVPFDNDKWVRYSSLNFGIPVSGYEVCALFNNDTRKGLIVGSVEHDTWKTGIRATTATTNILTRLEVFAGVTSNETRDVLPHGQVKNTTIKSPRMMIGYFDDWRRGMETYGDANAILAPRLSWTKGKPFGWNSWGAIQTHLSLTNATEVSQYFYDNLQNHNFSNDSTVYIGLDSYWDNIAYSDLFRFVRDCKTRKQNVGIYWTPFVDWGKDPNRTVEGAPGVLYKDIYLYANGKPQEIAGAYAIDPTHPASKLRANLFLKRFIDQGFTFLKLDFMTHGSLESDSHYDPTVFTGIQAYNQGLKYIVDYLKERMFINFSISPLFPTQYGHSRRIACDAYSSITDTEYTLNSLTYGWWLDHAYTYNDGDNVVLNGVSLGENRARVTSSVITGIFIVGDDYSSTGYGSAKTKAQTFLTNAEVNRIARLSKAFYPVKASNGSTAADMFMQQVADTTYLAVYNYDSKTATKDVLFDQLGLQSGSDYIFHELWNDTKEQHSGSWSANVPKRDVMLFKIYKGTLTSTGKSIKQTGLFFYPNPCKDELYFNHSSDTDFTLTAYNIVGQPVKVFNSSNKILYVGDLKNGLYLFSAVGKNGEHFIQKIMKE
jgi:alpha-galactosidase